MSGTLALKAKLYPLFAMSDHGVFSDRCTNMYWITPVLPSLIQSVFMLKDWS